MIRRTIEYAIKKQPSVLLILFYLVMEYIKEEKERIQQIEEAEIEYLGETYSIPVEKLKEDINLLKNIQLEQTGKYSFRISPFKD